MQNKSATKINNLYHSKNHTRYFVNTSREKDSNQKVTRDTMEGAKSKGQFKIFKGQFKNKSYDFCMGTNKID